MHLYEDVQDYPQLRIVLMRQQTLPRPITCLIYQLLRWNQLNVFMIKIHSCFPSTNEWQRSFRSCQVRLRCLMASSLVNPPMETWSS